MWRKKGHAATQKSSRAQGKYNTLLNFRWKNGSQRKEMKKLKEKIGKKINKDQSKLDGVQGCISRKHGRVPNTTSHSGHLLRLVIIIGRPNAYASDEHTALGAEKEKNLLVFCPMS